MQTIRGRDLQPQRKRSRDSRLVRFASRVAGLVGVHYYDMLYSEKALLGEIEHIEAPLDLEVRPASPKELDHLRTLMTASDAQLSLRVAARRSECLIAWQGGSIAGYSWLNREAVLWFGDRVLALPSEGAYTFFSFVWPAYRGRKIFQVLTEEVYLRLKREGFSFCCNLVDSYNAGSIGARDKFGAMRCAAPLLKLPGARPWWVRGRPPMGMSLPAPL